MVSKVQPELLRQVSVNKLLGANSMALQNAGVAARSSEVCISNSVSMFLGCSHRRTSWCRRYILY